MTVFVYIVLPTVGDQGCGILEFSEGGENRGGVLPGRLVGRFVNGIYRVALFGSDFNIYKGVRTIRRG